MAAKIDQIKKLRYQKVADLRSQKIDPYPQPDLSTRQSSAQALKSLGKKVTLAGRLMTKRGHGRILFADLHDLSGSIQLFFQEKNLDKKQMLLVNQLDIGDIVTVSGTVIKSQTDQTTLDVSSWSLLAKAIRPLPEKWHGLKDVEERYRQRYLDLIVNPEVLEVFKTRSKILTSLRTFLDEHGFLEVETPILQPVYGGASAQPFVTHHNALDTDMYLRISDELYLKRLIVGGLEKVYEVSRDFRNEGMSRFHNPEFTQVEFYWAYVDYDVLMKFTEELITHLIKVTKDSLQITFQGQKLDFTPPFDRITFRQAILDKTGLDIDTIKSEDDFKKALSRAKIKIDTSQAVGLGALFDCLYKEKVRDSILKPTFITDYPASMIALAKRKADDPEKIASFQLLAAGIELLKAYNELNDPVDQKDRWLEEEALAKKGSLDAMQFDHDYIRALEYGMPPTAGWGMGIDRLTQFLTNQTTIKDVILFPSLKKEDRQD